MAPDPEAWPRPSRCSDRPRSACTRVAIVGIGVAVGGLWRTSLAAEVASLVVVATYLIDLIAPPLHLPDWVHQLALTAHLGQPMIGVWDPVGVVLCLVIAVGGVLLGAWGMSRRDLSD